MHDVLGFMYNIAKVVLVAAVVLAADCWRVELTASAGDGSELLSLCQNVFE